MRLIGSFFRDTLKNADIRKNVMNDLDGAVG